MGLRQADNLDVVLAVRSPEPQLVLDDWAADVEAPIQNLIRVVRLVGPQQSRVAVQGAWQIGRFQAVVVEGELGAPLERVGAATRHEIDADAAGLDLQVVAAGVDCHLVEGIEIEVRRGRPARRRVGDGDAIEVPHRVGKQRALTDESRLLSRFVAADIHAIDDNARHGFQQRPGILRLRRALQLVLRERRNRPDLLEVHHGRFGGHHDRLFHRLHRHRKVDGRADAGRDDDLAFHLVEAGETRRQFVRACVKIQESKLALTIGHGRAGRTANRDSRQRDVDAGQHATLLVDDAAIDVATCDLRSGIRDQYADQQRHRHGEHSFHTGAPECVVGRTDVVRHSTIQRRGCGICQG